MSEGYSGTALAKKLGHKPGAAWMTIAMPDSVAERLAVESEAVLVHLTSPEALGADLAGVHFFTKSALSLERVLPLLEQSIREDGMIWISWPKKASKVPTDVTEDVIRRLALVGRLVDVKVCAVDAIWSGLKLVVRKELRRT